MAITEIWKFTLLVAIIGNPAITGSKAVLVVYLMEVVLVEFQLVLFHQIPFPIENDMKTITQTFIKISLYLKEPFNVFQ